MISVKSFFKLLKEDTKQRLAVPLLASLVLFFSQTIYSVFATNIIRKQGFALDSNSVESYLEYFAPAGGFMIVVAAVGAIICGLSGTSYMMSRQKVDFYHSLPIKREMLLVERMVAGALFYMAPYLVSMLLSIIVNAVNGTLYGKLVGAMFTGFVFNSLIFITLQASVFFASMLCGTIVTGFFATAFVWGYAPAAYTLLWAAGSIFYRTIYSGGFDNIFSATKLCSPFSAVIWAASTKEGELADIYKTTGIGVKHIVVLLVMLFVFTVLSFVVYRLRKSESAGASVAFDVVRVAVRYLIVVPIALFGGMMFTVLLESGVMAFFFGVILFAFLCFGFVECIFLQDARKCFSNRKGLVISLLASVLISASIYGDWFGYDRNIPKAQEVESVSIVIPNTFGTEQSTRVNGHYVSANDYILNFMEINDKTAVIDFAEKASKESRSYEYKKDASAEYGDYYIESRSCVNVWFRLKSGRIVKRSYYIVINDYAEEFAKICDDAQYRSFMLALAGETADYADVPEGKTGSVYEGRVNFYETGDTNGVYSALIDMKRVSGDERLAEFTELYKNDYMKADSKDIISGDNWGWVSFEIKYEGDPYFGYANYVYGRKEFRIYSYMTDTKQWLLDNYCEAEYDKGYSKYSDDTAVEE